MWIPRTLNIRKPSVLFLEQLPVPIFRSSSRVMAHAYWNLKREFPEKIAELNEEYKSRVGDF